MTSNTCTGVGTFATNVIKAASFSCAAMNAMLKAQMLATALDVYFSDASKGGNKIGSPNKIGDAKVDLTKVCKMLAQSGGVSTCSGSTVNSGPAFGDSAPYPTSMKVSDMLTYAASKSNSGGSSWYGQSKSIQELAKNAFDAINNGAALSAP